MNYQKFVNIVKDEVTERFPQKEVEVVTVTKNNQISKVGLSFRNKTRNETVEVAPTIYLEDLYYHYKNDMIGLNEVVNEICSYYSEAQKWVDENEYVGIRLDDYDSLKNRIVCFFVNKEMNKDTLKDIPYILYHDLAIIFKIAFDVEKGEVTTTLIRNGHLNMWGITLEDIAAIALQNTEELFPGVLLSMNDVIKEMTGEDIEVNDMMYVLSNRQRMNGAITILYSKCLEKIGNILKENFYLIPSSIHEMILIKESGVESIEYLNEMIKEVNASAVIPEEVLADRAYYYDRNTGIVSDC